MKSELSAIVYNKNKQQTKKLCAFTLAEILLSLTVIGIVAAIALPSLLGNANERAWETQKKALYTRFSQALPLLPSLNGYGQLEGTLSQGTKGQEGYVPQNVTVDTAAETFVRDGLSKVMKITNICDSEHLTDCGLPDKIIPMNGAVAINISDITSLEEFNPAMNDNPINSSSNAYVYRQLISKAAAFETVNGESILAYYNPNCEPNLYEQEWHFTQPKMCANFIYDLNGKKGPNTVGKDIGFITALYSTDPVVTAPIPYLDSTQKAKWVDVAIECKKINKEAKVPNIDEAIALFYNYRLIDGLTRGIWTSSAFDSENAWRMTFTHGASTPESKTYERNTLCIKR